MKKLGFGLWIGLFFPFIAATSQAAPVPLFGFPVTMPATPPTFEEFTQKLDHFDPSNQQTFQQRFVIDSRYATDSDAPVVLYVCGEGNCISDELSPNGYQWRLAEDLGAHFVALEHRYYGQSLPFPDLTAETFKYLSVEQAIEDLATFEQWAVSNRGLTGKWISIGGSYPADLAAIYRLKHPELVSGAIASSACAHYDEGGNQPDTVAARTAGPECVSKYRAQILDPILAAIGNPQKMAELKKVFDGSDISDDVDFVGALTGMAIFDIQELGATSFCDSLNQSDPRTAFAATLKKFIGAWGTRLIDWSYTGMASTQGSKYGGALGTRQWMYQACTQMGRFTGTVMKANPDPSQSLSSPLTDSLPPKYCAQFFGLQSAPTIDEMNQKYYEPLLDPSTSNILFVSGSNDPACFPFSISKENGNDTNPNTVTYTVDGGSHCQDLTPPKENDSDSLQGARDLEMQLSHRWTEAE